MDNALVFIRQTLYQLKKDYGFSVDIYKILTSEVNLSTGRKSFTYSQIKIRRAIALPSILSRKFSYDLSFIAANKNFTYGGFYDVNSRVFIVDGSDVPKSFVLTVDDYLIYDNKRYDIKQFEALEHKQGYLITAKETVGQKPYQILTPKVQSTFAVGQSASGVL